MFYSSVFKIWFFLSHGIKIYIILPKIKKYFKNEIFIMTFFCFSYWLIIQNDYHKDLICAEAQHQYFFVFSKYLMLPKIYQSS